MLKHIDINNERINQIFHCDFEVLNSKIVCVLIHEKGASNILNNKISRFLSCL